MMQEKRIEQVVGLFVFIAVVLLVAGLYWGKEKEWFSGRDTVTVRFDDVQGLREGDPVTVRGIEQGTVDRIRLLPEYAEVILKLKKGVALRNDVTIMLQNRDLMGARQVAIHPGQSAIPADMLQPFAGSSEKDTNTLLADLGKTLARVDSLFRTVSGFLDAGKVERLWGNVDAAVWELKAFVRDNRKGVRETVESIHGISHRMESDSTVLRISRASVRLDSTANRMNRILCAMENGEGTLGGLVQDRGLYDRMMKTLTGLDSLVADVRANPQKYIRVSVF